MRDFRTHFKAVNRYELKYLLRFDQAARVLSDLIDYMTPDRHGDSDGQYAITSLYFDSPDFKAYWDKVEGHPFRRKVRVRAYGRATGSDIGGAKVTPDTPCYAEIKQRNNKTLQKKRVLLPYATAVAVEDYERLIPDADESDSRVLQEIFYLHQTLQLQPACIVQYNRIAFNGGPYDPGLRVTFDTDLRCRAHDLSLLSTGQATNRFFLPPEFCVMEVKVNYRAPYWLTQIIGKHGCTLRRVSKYCLSLAHSHDSLGRERILI
jgi:hypothetical protein